MGFIFWLSIAQTGMTSCFALVTAPCTHLFSLCPNRTQLKHRRCSEKNRRGFSRVPYTRQASPQYDSLHPNMQWGTQICNGAPCGLTNGILSSLYQLLAGSTLTTFVGLLSDSPFPILHPFLLNLP